MSEDADRLSRRRTLQVLLGTGVSAVAWNAPRIEGYWIAPDYAAAASVPRTATGVKVIALIADGGRTCGGANSATSAAGLPGVTFTIVNKLCQRGFTFEWSISPGCTVTGMYCTEAAALAGTPFTSGFVAGTSGVGATCYPNLLGGLWIDVECV